MRTLIFVLACVAMGYGIALVQFKNRTAGIKNFVGPAENMEEAIAAATSPAAKTPGRIEVVGGTDLDFGTMRRGSRRSHKFVFKNVGGTPVSLAFKSSTCKCTVGKFESQVLQPGESTDVELEWLAEKGAEEFGQTATIATNAIDQEEIKLSIHGQIGQAYVVDPPDFNLGNFQTTEQVDITGRIYSFEETPLHIQSGGWLDLVTSKKVQIEVGEMVKLEKGEVPRFADARYAVDFRVKILPGIPAGTFSGDVRFAKKSKEDGETDEFIFFPIRGRSVSVISVIAGNDYNEDRNIFQLGSAKSSEGLKKSFTLKIRNEDAAEPTIKVSQVVPKPVSEVMKVTIDDPIISAKQKLFRVTLEIPPGTPPMEYEGKFGKDFAKIVLETNIETAPLFPMYFKFSIKE